jgi:hypothetical protein
MQNFKTFLTESLDVEKLKHLEHLEDHIIHGGHEGVEHAADTLNDVYTLLTGGKTKTKITQKYDGAPSVVFGINPENGHFFVATKSAFNKDPKIAYSDEDIQSMYGHAPGLAAKLSLALKELPNIMPKKGGVFQGDLMYSKDDLKDEEGALSFTPNAITYTVDKDSPQGRRASAANIGIVVHTRYVGSRGYHTKLQDMKADFDVDQRAFQNDPNVHMINPEVQGASISNIEKTQFEKTIAQATKQYADMGHDGLEFLEGHDVIIKTYVNTTVRDGSKPSAAGFLKYIKGRYAKDVEKLKSEAGKLKKQKEADEIIAHFDENKDNLDAMFKVHNSLQKAKDILNSALASSVDSGFRTSMGGEPTKPEGFVAIRNGRPSKIVDRAEFSRNNFLHGAFQKNNEIKPDDGKSTPTKPIVMTFGRMNPPTAQGHGAVINKVKEIAAENNAPHAVVLSDSQDPEKNPLSPEQKFKHASRMFPDTNILMADKDAPNVIDQVKKFYKAGHDHLVLVVGSDRVEGMKKLLDERNGKDFLFKKIDVISAGERDPDSDDETQAMSATKLRDHAINRRYEEFKKGMPQHLHDDHAKELFNDVQRGMDIKIDANTNAITLGKLAKRQDPIGVKARKEQERRRVEKEVKKKTEQDQKAAAKAAKAKSKK